MRLWSIHPRYLDAIGLVAAWREALLAKKVLQGRTRGYRRHPQLDRFRNQSSPVVHINVYLRFLWIESMQRGFKFDRSKIGRCRSVRRITVTDGQLNYEMSHLRHKLGKRDRQQLSVIAGVRKPSPHPLFKRCKGPVEQWERR